MEGETDIICRGIKFLHLQFTQDLRIDINSVDRKGREMS
ncbi:hypothetical protein AM1_0736 [Acaryochloris marina MBIC11017]|uniref:Uncharacterized protein n=1 Tax=Acaryochloris marina (strain MBIC 11017) TaxID=329726 RepID=B0CF95_ACAM1|nr:hypothetical protein AM1_0736 [Acaryochloris marina MBIC11017]